jgi:hypothetical protein
MREHRRERDFLARLSKGGVNFQPAERGQISTGLDNELRIVHRDLLADGGTLGLGFSASNPVLSAILVEPLTWARQDG